MRKPSIRLNTPGLAALFAIILTVSTVAEEARFFRITGPVPATITGFSADGYITWSNVATNATFTVQSAPCLLSQSNLLDSTNWVDYVQVPATNPSTTSRLIDVHPPMGMVLIPTGSFTMGDNLDGDGRSLPLHTVYVSGFYMDKYAVTKALWDDVYNWATNHGYPIALAAKSKAPNHPAQTVMWYDAVAWCNARSEKEGRTPAYYTSAAQTTVYRHWQPAEIQNDCVNWTNGYRLPTEAQWEKAARGGLIGQRFPWGNTISWAQANYSTFAVGQYSYDLNATSGYDPAFKDGVLPYTNPVDYFAPNGYGLYDMAGNVEQWCWDSYDSYSIDAQSDPCGPTPGSYPCRTIRGNSHNNPASSSRTAFRGCATGNTKGYEIGFRCVLSPGQ